MTFADHHHNHQDQQFCFPLSQNRASRKPLCQCPDQGVSPNTGFPPWRYHDNEDDNENDDDDDDDDDYDDENEDDVSKHRRKVRMKMTMMLTVTTLIETLALECPCLFPGPLPPPELFIINIISQHIYCCCVFTMTRQDHHECDSSQIT